MKQTLDLGILLALVTLIYLPISAQTLNSYEEYLEARQQVMRQDSQLYFDYAISLSDKEQKLNQQLLSLQKQMLQTYKDQHFFPPARNFYQSKEHIEKTKLFEFIKELPKGGILHLHSGAMGDVDWMIQKAKSLPEMYVYWDSKSSSATPKGTFHAYKKGAIPEGYLQVKALLKAQPSAYQELRSLLVFEEEMDRDSVDIWGEFQLVFTRINDFLNYRPAYEDYIVHGMEILIADNIQHCEMRTAFLDRLYDLDNPKGSLGIESFAAIYENIERRIKVIDPEFSFHIIHCSLRFKDGPAIWKEMEDVFSSRKKYPHLVRGFDLVAEEDAGHSTLFHANQFLRLDSLEAAHNVHLPLYLHDGESNWASVDNLYDAVLLGSKRIGHGYNLYRFPQLLELVKEKDICLEISPLSNQILGYIRDLRNHPASTYLRRGINCTISSDDPLIFDYHGLSYDYWSIFLAWELDLAALKKLSYNGIYYSSLTLEEKGNALRIWDRQWDAFVDEMLTSGLLKKSN